MRDFEKYKQEREMRQAELRAAMGPQQARAAAGETLYNAATDQWMYPPPGVPMYHPPLKMIAMRMKWAEGEIAPLEFIATHQCSDRMLVFVVHKDQPVTIEDDLGLFPSDALITKLRLMIG